MLICAATSAPTLPRFIPAAQSTRGRLRQSSSYLLRWRSHDYAPPSTPHALVDGMPVLSVPVNFRPVSSGQQPTGAERPGRRPPGFGRLRPPHGRAGGGHRRPRSRRGAEGRGLRCPPACRRGAPEVWPRGEGRHASARRQARAVAAQPAEPAFLHSLGWAHFKLGRFEEAERHLSESVRRGGASALVHEHLGDAYDRQGRTRPARDAWSKAISLSARAEDKARLKRKLSGAERQ